ncbi:MAG TPA: AMP-binding protein [Fluviicoccus sp.]|nr:AMP-binding protein [Fluviicoccus sp.]
MKAKMASWWKEGVQVGGQMMIAGVGLTRAGILAPVRPDRLARLAWRSLHEGTNFATLLTAAAVRFPDRIVIEDDMGALSYADLDTRAQAIAAALAADGIGAGDTVALMCRNHRGFVEGLLAVSRLGADVVLLNTEFPAPQLRQVLDRHALSLVIHDGEFNSVFVKAGYDGRRVLADSQGAPGSLCSLASRHEPAPGPRRQGQIIILTSGTTGVPKGAPRKTPALAAVGPIATLFNTLPLRSGEPVLIGTPLFHGFGLAFLAVALSLGSTMVLCRRFDADKVAQLLVMHQVKTFVAVPVMLQRLLDIPAVGRYSWSFRHLSTVISAGAPLGASLATRWMDTHGENLFNLYGSTEAGVGTLATPQDMRAAPGTVGRMPLGTDLRILDSNGCALPAGLPGHICVRSGMLFEGYVGGGSKPMLNGYMNTGDIGHVDAEGRLFVEGREDDMIVSGGENVFPLEVEEWLSAYPGVVDVAVVGVKDEEFGQRLKAFVVAGADADFGPETLKGFLRERIARYKVPRDIVLVAELPRNATGKVLRGQLASR